MILVKDGISLDELKEMSKKMFGQVVKAVVDIKKGIMVVDAEMHSDQEEFLLEQGSHQGDLWGINIRPHEYGGRFIEFDSMINLRPGFGNRTRSVDDPRARDQILTIVTQLVRR